MAMHSRKASLSRMLSKLSRQAIFLCLLILLDEFCVKAEYLSSNSRHISHVNIQSPVTFVDQTENDVGDFYQSNTTTRSREKRGVFIAILVGASIVASLANLGFDIYLHIKGCCGIYPSACRYRDEFDNLKKVLTSKSKTVDNMWTSAENTKEWVQQCNMNNRVLWLEIIRIADAQDELVEALSADVIVGFYNTSIELKKRIREKNATILGISGAELSVKFESPFSSVKNTLLALSGIVGHIGSILIGKAIHAYKINKMANFLKSTEGSRLINAGPKAQKFFGVSKTKLNQHFKTTANARYRAQAGAKPVRAKVATGAAAVLAIITIGLEIYSAVMKVKACQNIRDNAHDAVKQMRRANSDMDKTLRDVREYKRKLTVDGWNKIRSELLRKDLSDVLNEFRVLALGASTQSKVMKDAVVGIDTFKRGIRHANYEATYNLQRSLIKALAGVKFSLECYRNLVKGTTYIIDHCKKGDGQFSDLWDRITFYFNLNAKACHDEAGVPYTTKEKMKNAIKAQASKNNFNADCILNSKDIKYLVCAKKYRGYTASEIANQLKLTVAQANFVLPNCPPEPITPQVINTICRLRQKGVSMDDIIAVTRVDFLKAVEIIIKHCTPT